MAFKCQVIHMESANKKKRSKRNTRVFTSDKKIIEKIEEIKGFHSEAETNEFILHTKEGQKLFKEVKKQLEIEQEKKDQHNSEVEFV